MYRHIDLPLLLYVCMWRLKWCMHVYWTIKFIVKVSMDVGEGSGCWIFYEKIQNIIGIYIWMTINLMLTQHLQMWTQRPI